MKEWEKQIKKNKGCLYLVITEKGQYVCKKNSIGYMVRFGTMLILNSQVKKVLAL